MKYFVYSHSTDTWCKWSFRKRFNSLCKSAKLFEIKNSSTHLAGLRPTNNENYLFVLHVDVEERLSQFAAFLTGFTPLWKACSSVLVFLDFEATDTQCDGIVEAFDKASCGSLGKLKIVRNDLNEFGRMLNAACRNGTLSKTDSKYWHKLPNKPVVWMCNYDQTGDTDEERLGCFQKAEKSVTLPFGDGVTMASARYGLINAELPKCFYVLLLVHLTHERAAEFAADLEDMGDLRIARLFYCLYSGGGCSAEELEKFQNALGEGRADHCQMIRTPLEKENAEITRDIAGLCESFLKAAKPVRKKHN